MRRVTVLLLCVVSFTSGRVSARPSQAQASAPAVLEVASIRRVPSGRAGYTEISPTGGARFTARNISMRLLIAVAYGVDTNRIQSQFGWIDSTFYDIVAKPEGDEPLTVERTAQLLQQVLTQRFHLTSHHESKQVSGYALVVAKDGSKLKPSTAATGTPYILRDGLRGRGIGTATLAGMLASPAGRPVMDKTGLTGTFDVELAFAPIDDPNSTAPSLLTALGEQLGLKLVPARVPIDLLVLDRLEKEPTEN